MDVRQLGIRVLYTLNGNQQYYLALPTRKVPVTLLTPPAHHFPPGTTPPPPAHGTAAFRACLDEILNSSPEITPDGQQDFSVYVLDPLESGSTAHLHPARGTATAPSTQGVAIGLGLMSWALNDPACAITVTGTLFNDPVRGHSLEVVLALRSTPTIPRRPAQTWDAPQASTSKAAVTKRKSSIHRSYSTPEGCSALLHATASTSSAPTIVRSNPTAKPKPKSVRPNPTSTKLSPHQGIPSTSASASVAASSSSTSTSNTAATTTDAVRQLLESVTQTDRSPELFELLRSLGATENPIINRAVVEAMTKLLYPSPPRPAPSPPAPTTARRRTPSSSTLTSRPSSSARAVAARTASISSLPSLRPPPSPEKGGSDDEIVVLDKENVNPAAFRRRRNGKEAASSSAANSRAPSPAREGERAAQRVPSNVLASNTNSPSKASGSGSNRKRTLSDFLDERDADRERARKRTTSQGQLHSRRTSQSQLRRTSTLPAAVMSDSGLDTGPARGWATSTFIPAPASSPPRPSAPFLTPAPASTAAQRQPYVVPEWARTETATRPRFAEDRETEPEGGQPAETSHPNANAKPARKRPARNARRGSRKGKAPATPDENSPEKVPSRRLMPPPSTTPSVSRPRTLARSASSSSAAAWDSDAAHPVVAHPSDGIFDFTLSSSAPPSPSPRRSMRSPALPRTVPRTPTRRRPSAALLDDDDHSPLFTPKSKKRTPRVPVPTSEKKLPSLYANAALFSPVRPPPSPSPSHVPSSPGLLPSSPARHMLPPAPAASLPDLEADVISSEFGALPIVGGDESDARSPLEDPPRRLLPHWAVDLPPSSPFPPSSPVLSSYDDDGAPPSLDLNTDADTDDFLPPSSQSPPSDSDPASGSRPGAQNGAAAHTPATEAEEQDPQDDAPLTLAQLSSMFMSDDFSSALSSEDMDPVSALSSENMDPVSAPSSDFFPATDATSTTSFAGDAAAEPPLEDMNLEEVWASIKGLLEQNCVALPPGSLDAVNPSMLTRTPGTTLGIDTQQLAQDVQDLFGGCVV